MNGPKRLLMPVLAFALAAFLLWLDLTAGPTLAIWLLYLPLSLAAFWHGPTPVSWLTALLGSALPAASGVIAWQNGAGWTAWLQPLAALACLWTTLALVHALRRQNLTLQKRLDHLILDISEREQRRISADLHDGLGQELTALAMLTSVLQHDLEARHLPEAATAARLADRLDHARQQLHHTVHGLSPLAPDPGALMAGLERHVQSCRDTVGCQCLFHCPAPVLIPDPAHATHLFRIAQEAIHNAVRHSHSQHITVRLLREPAAVVLEVEDHGRGLANLPATHPGLGLRSMKDRAAAMHGRLELDQPPQGGTRLRCVIPAPAEPSPTRSTSGTQLLAPATS